MEGLFQLSDTDEAIAAQIPPLQEGKSKHLFFSFCNEDNDKILPIVDETETRFNLKCIYADRDFQPGKDISVNIQESMMMSTKVVLFLSPAFLESGWCKYETDVAFVTSMGCGYNCIVPILLEECEIPPTLVTLTYIDATAPGVDIPAKIASSLICPNTDDGLLTLNIRSWNKTFENGYCHILEGERDDLCVVRPARYAFKTTPRMLDQLRECGIELPESLLKKAFDIVNNNSIMWSYDYLSRRRTCAIGYLVMIPTFILINLCVMSMLPLYLTRQPPTDDTLKRTAYETSEIIETAFSVIFWPIWFVVGQLVICFLPNCCHRKQRDINIQYKLWKMTKKECIQNNVLLLFSSRRNKLPTIHVMRYNIKRCRDYFVGVVKTKNIRPVDTELTHETYADLLIEHYLEEMMKTLADDFDQLPDAPMNRHNVKLGKMCICQQLERNLI